MYTCPNLSPSLPRAVHGHLSAHLHLPRRQHRPAGVCGYRGEQFQCSQAGQLCSALCCSEEMDGPCAEDITTATHQEASRAWLVVCVHACVWCVCVCVCVRVRVRVRVHACACARVRVCVLYLSLACELTYHTLLSVSLHRSQQVSPVPLQDCDPSSLQTLQHRHHPLTVAVFLYTCERGQTHIHVLAIPPSYAPCFSSSTVEHRE